MNSRHLIDPELLPGLEQLPQMEFNAENLPLFRAGMAELYDLQAPALPEHAPVNQREVRVPGAAGAPEVRLLVFGEKPGCDPRPAYYHIHGGGFVIGSADMSIAQCQAVAAELDCVVVSVDYRLAPETTFPGNIEDCYAGLTWLYAQASVLDVDSGRIAIGGESAGGGLAAALALLVRDRGEIPLVYQLLVYPMLDDRLPENLHPYAGEFGWTVESNRFGWRSLLGREAGADDVSPYAAAARAEDLRGLPPTFIGVGSLDLFLEQNLEYARRLSRAGVPVELHVYPGAYHGSDVVAEARLTRMHKRDQLAALRVALAA